MKKVFGFDLDGVLYPWFEAVYDYLREIKKDVKPFVEFWQDAIDNTDGLSETFWNNMCEMEILYSKFPAKNSDVQTLQELSKNFDIVYISHRPQNIFQTTHSWLKRYGFPNPDNLCLTTLPKDLIVRKYNCYYYIEDKGKILSSNLRNVVNLIAKRTYWNWDECETLPYVDTVDELPKLLLEIT